ncbi:Uma2 family endonuclease [Bythopirellula goksoeyrii]|uniref:Putative restriction endonuclease domain-containing protein n=1 Tax=Bythopirellula goksoeyrii TaxID=1400387 RepID=A0A5B9QGB8_9BACT|nr:Uma2 family endonuclease [Bythopirellula goksoeyrii]QEG33391.1 hypothetical protein Pr1d_06520 [Bythopirellula goksoeyrii]
MSTHTLTTADELLALPRGMGVRYELVLGELRTMSPTGWHHGSIVSKLHVRLAAYVDANNLGMMFGAETGFRLSSDPDTVRAPDIAFVAKENVPVKLLDEGFWPGAPDLAVEVLSPSDRTGEVNEKIDAWLKAGCVAVWIVDPKLETVTTHHPHRDIQVNAAGESMSDDIVLPGFSCAVKDLF